MKFLTRFFGADPDKTVFISYRRAPSQYLALLLYKDLTKRGYDVFLDIERINSGSFEEAILNQIRARTHFIAILTPGTLERCVNPKDWVRREIELAISTQRNVIPFTTRDFSFSESKPFLTGKLFNLPKYNAFQYDPTYHDPGIDDLCKRYLKPPDFVVSPIEIPEEDIEYVETQLKVAEQKPQPTKSELKAETSFSVGLAYQEAEKFESAIEFYTEALTINPKYHRAFYNRGLCHHRSDDLHEALHDYDRSIQINP